MSPYVAECFTVFYKSFEMLFNYPGKNRFDAEMVIVPFLLPYQRLNSMRRRHVPLLAELISVSPLFNRGPTIDSFAGPTYSQIVCNIAS